MIVNLTLLTDIVIHNIFYYYHYYYICNIIKCHNNNILYSVNISLFFYRKMYLL